ncbi:MAG: hydrolase, partial [Anaerotignum sp.]
MKEKNIPRIDSKLRKNIVTMPEAIWSASGIVILGRRIKSLIFSTDIAIIRNCNADAVLAVYPFTPQQIIADAIVSSSSLP